MEVSNEIKEDIRKTQNELKNAIRVHQAWVVRLKEDQNNVNIKRNIREAEKDIIAIGHTQKKVTERLRLELELYQQKLKARNKQINPDYDHRHIAQQLRDYQLQNRTRKKSTSLLKPSVLSEINIKTENNNGNGTNKSEDDYDEPMFVEQTNGVKIKEQLEDDEFIRATENFSLKDPAVHNIQDSRAHFANTLNKAKQRICPPVELVNPIKRSPSASPKSGTPSPPRTERSPTLSPSPPPSLPSLPLPGEEVCQETFLRFLGLITPKHRQMLEKKRNERKKRSTTSTNKTDYVYGNFDLQTKKRKLNFPYLQQNIAPPTTRAQQRAKRQQEQQQLQQTQQRSSPRPSPPSPASPALSSSSPPDSPPPPPLPQHPFLTLPNGLTILPVVSPDPMPCCVCNQNDVPSLLRHCRGCGSYFHWSCATREGRSPPRKPPTAPDCPQCGETVKESRQSSSMTVIGYANKPSEAIIKEKISEKRLLQERNQQLRSDLKKLEMRAETLKENIESKNVVKKKLLSEQIETQKNLQKLLEFVGKFKDTPSYPVRRLVKEDSNCSDSN